MKTKKRVAPIFALIFLAGSVFAPHVAAQEDSVRRITGAEARDHVGAKVTVCGPVASARQDTSVQGRPTFLNLDHPYPRQSLVVVIPGALRDSLGKTETDFLAARICATGTVEELQQPPGLLRIVVSGSAQLKVSAHGERESTGVAAARCDYHDPVWSPGGERIAFGSNRTGDFEVYTIRRDGSELTRITHRDGGDGGPAWAPDGRRLAFTSVRDGAGSLYIADLRDGSTTRVSPAIEGAGAPAWSPDGQTIFYEAPENRDIHAVDLGSGTVRSVIASPANDFRPAPSPSGEWLAFNSNRSGQYQLYLTPVAGGEVEALTAGDVHSTAPKWSPDGRRIVFTSTPNDEAGDLHVLDVVTRETTLLTTHPALDYAPSWSPDGRMIVFVSQRAGANQLFTIDIESKETALLIGGCAP